MKIKTLIILLLGLIFITSAGLAQEEEENLRFFDSVEFLTGFGWNRLQRQSNYNLYPFLFDFNFSLKPLLKKINFSPPPLLQIQLEPFISAVTRPKSNIETGASFFFKFGILPETSKIQPYIKLGFGLVYMTQHTEEQSTKFNFTETGCAGLHYFLTKNIGLSAEYRFRHLSNAGLDSPNHGINTKFAVLGVTYKF